MFIFHMAWLNLQRQNRKSVLTLALCALLVSFLCVYFGNIHSAEDQLANLPQAIVVPAHVSNLNGSMRVGLRIDGKLLDSIIDDGWASDFVTSVQLAANFAPESAEERVGPKNVSIAGINDLAVYPGITTDIDHGVFSSDDPVCVVNPSFLTRYGLETGDTISLALYYFVFGNSAFSLRYEYLDTVELTIVGTYEANGNIGSVVVRDVLCPIEWVKHVFRLNFVDYFADSAAFNITDPLNLNVFKSAMRELGFTSVNAQADMSVKGDALVVDDEIFIRSATILLDNLALLYTFLPALVLLVLLVGFVSSHLMLQSRRGEYSVMRLLGTSRRMCSTIFLFESGITAFLGSCIGLFVGLLIGINLEYALLALISFWFVFTIGTYLAVLMLGGVNVISSLTKAD